MVRHAYAKRLAVLCVVNDNDDHMMVERGTSHGECGEGRWRHVMVHGVLE